MSDKTRLGQFKASVLNYIKQEGSLRTTKVMVLPSRLNYSPTVAFDIIEDMVKAGTIKEEQLRESVRQHLKI